jgi:hypothetical protein
MKMQQSCNYALHSGVDKLSRVSSAFFHKNLHCSISSRLLSKLRHLPAYFALRFCDCRSTLATRPIIGQW